MGEHQLEHFIRSGGLKVTPQRLMLLREIEAQGHLDVDELFRRAQAHFPSISLATIYKNLHTLSENGILREVPLPGKRSVYELHHAEHVHFFCTECNKVCDVEADMSDIADMLRERTGYQFDTMRVTLGGPCPGPDKCMRE